MDWDEAKKIFSEQLQLLAEHSRVCADDHALCEITDAMVNLVKIAFSPDMI